MRIYINIRAYKLTGETKQEVIDRICSVYVANWASTSSYSGYRSCEGSALGISFVKYNKKTKQKKVNGKTQSIIIRKKHWKAYCYVFTKEILMMMNKKLIQHNNHFELINK